MALGSSVAGPRSCGGGRPGCPSAVAGFAHSRVWPTRLLVTRGVGAGGGRPKHLRRASRGRPALPHPCPRVTTATRPARRPPAPLRGLGLLPAGSAHGGRSSTEDAETVSDGSGPGSFPAAQRGGVGSFVGPSGPPGAALPSSRSNPEGDSRRIPRSIPPGPRGWKLRETRFRGSFPPNRTKCGCACSAPARMNPDRATVRPLKRSSSGAIG